MMTNIEEKIKKELESEMEGVAKKVGDGIRTWVLSQVLLQFSYLYRFHFNIDTLRSKVQMLEDKRKEVQFKVDEAGDNLRAIRQDVTEWLEKVNVLKQDADKILIDEDKVGNECCTGRCLNMKLRYQLSSKAVDEASNIVAHLATAEGDHFKNVADNQLPSAVVRRPTRDDDDMKKMKTKVGHEIEEDVSYAAEDVSRTNHIASSSTSGDGEKGLESRELILKQVMEAVNDNQIRVVKICGMGGVGKTTMLRQVEKLVREEGLFNEVPVASFTEKPNYRLIQDNLAKSLGFTGLKNDEDDLPARACQLHKRLNDENKKILLIVDNIWKREDLEEVGILSRDKCGRCKILLTTRNNIVFTRPTTERVFDIKVLLDPEARSLFLQSLGDSHCYYTIAEGILKACGGLPLAINTIARAVAYKDESLWIDALRELQNPTTSGGEYGAMFSILKVSYDVLKSKEIKKFFRLCCLFGKGAYIPVEYLARYGMALRLFRRTRKLYEEREQAQVHIKTLLQSNLLLRGTGLEYVKMHDLVYDFAVELPSEGAFLVDIEEDGVDEWPRRDSYEHYTSISVLLNNLSEVSNGLNYPSLEILQLIARFYSSQILPDNIYKGMVGLGVLTASVIVDPLAPKSVHHLVNLRTLCLIECELKSDVSLIGKFLKLEILSFHGSTIKKLPTEIGKLRGLRLLDLTNCRLCKIAPGIFPHLTSLEELYMGGFNWDMEESLSKVIFTEISSLPKLFVIVVEVKREFLVQVDSFFHKVEKFMICVGSTERSMEDHYFRNTLTCVGEANDLLGGGMKVLIVKTEMMNIEVSGLKVLVNESEMELFSNKKCLKLERCAELVYLVNTASLRLLNVLPMLDSLVLKDMGALEEIYHVKDIKGSFNEQKPIGVPNLPVHLGRVPPQNTSFGQLTVLEVAGCRNLKSIFPLTVARNLGMLKRLEIKRCLEMIEIFHERKRGGEDQNVSVDMLQNLQYLSLHDLPNLVGFCVAACNVELPHLEELKLKKLPMVTSLCSGTNTSEEDQDSSSCPLFNQKGPHVRGFQNMKLLKVTHCSSLRQLFTPLMAITLSELTHLELKWCQSLEAIVATEGRKDEREEKLFPKLTHLLLNSLPKLSTAMPKGCTFDWSSMKIMRSLGCGDIFANMNFEKMALTSLEELTIEATNITEFWSNHFPGGYSYEMSHLVLRRCKTLSILFSSDLVRGFHQLEKIEVKECDSLEVLFDLGGTEDEFRIFNQLQSLKLFGLPRMRHVWKECLPCFKGFQNLTRLHLSECGSLNYLWSPLIAKCLVKLKHVDIFRCEEMKEVISRTRRDEKVEEEVDDITLFPNLGTLSLSNLPSLVTFGIEACFGAPNAGSSNTKQKGNASISSSSTIFNEKSSHIPTSALVGIVSHNFPTCSIPNLTIVEIFECNKLSSVFPSNILVMLPMLQTLKISFCNSLKYVLCSSMVRSLLQLGKLSIEYCQELVVVMKDEDGEVAAVDIMHKLVFPSLFSIYLTSLPNLKGISLEKHAFEWPILRSLYIDHCPKMRIFTMGCSSSPKLHFPHINGSEPTLLDGDIQEYFMGVSRKYDFKDFMEYGVLTVTGFLEGGDSLVGDSLGDDSITWSWESGESHKVNPNLPKDRQFLITRNVPCFERARASSSKVVELPEEKNENDGDEYCASTSGNDDKNIPKPRTYDVSITYDEDHKTPRFWLTGYNDESKTILPLELVIEDVAESHQQELVSVGDHPHLAGPHISLYPALDPSVMRDFYDRRNLKNYPLDVRDCLHLLLHSHAPLIPTIINVSI